MTPVFAQTGGTVELYAQLAVTGAAIGCLIALAAMGVVLTYKSTGVFNFAHGAVGVFCAYVVFQLHQWGIPIGLAAPLGILVAAPAIGLGLERFVFRPLQRRGATTSEKLVATLGAFVLFFGLVLTIWTGRPRTGPYLVSPAAFDLGAIRLGYNDLANIVLVVAVSTGLWALFRYTHLGIEIRAVVDRPQLAELASINANRIAGLSWAMGAALAALAGVMLSGGSLNPLDLTLLLLDSFAVAVIARLTNLPLAVGSAIVLLGVGKAWLGQLVVDLDLSGTVGQSLAKAVPNLGALLLLLFVLVYRHLDIVGEASEQSNALLGTGGSSGRTRRLGLTLAAVGGLVLLPAFLDSGGFDSAHRFLAMTVIFVSIVAVTGFSGQITLGQAGFAGLGAFVAARVSNSWDLPVILAMIVGGLVAMGAGVLAGYPALRRRGLFLALTTLAFGLFIYALVIDNEFLSGDSTRGLQVVRPSIFGWSLDGPAAFYYYELVWLGLMMLLARNLRSGALGRALAAMRDSEDGARSVGIDLRTYKVFIFGASSFIAGIGGALLTQQAENFNPLQFFPLESLFWFAVVVVAGVGSLAGALVGGFVFVMLDRIFDVAGLSQLAIGAGALALGRLPGGNLVGMARVGYEAVVHRGRVAMAEALQPPAPRPRYRPTAYALDVLASPRPVVPSERERHPEGAGR